MMRRALIAAGAAFALLLSSAPAGAEVENCVADPRPECFEIESASVALSTTQAGAHPDLELDVGVEQNLQSAKNPADVYDTYGATRNIRIVSPPGFIGDPNVIGSVQQCSVQQLFAAAEFNGAKGCPNGSQIGISTVSAYELAKNFHEPVYMMQPPGGDVVARMGLVAGLYPTFIDFHVRSESDYALVAEVTNAPAIARLVRLETTLWGVPAAEAHDKERCTPFEVFNGCTISIPPRPPGGNELPFLTNPTRCGTQLSIGVNASSWVEPEFDPSKEKSAPFPTITGCDHLPFGPSLAVEPTSHHTSAASGLEMTIKLPASPGVKVLEPSQTRYMRIDLPVGFAVNTDSADGLETCSAKEVGFEESVASKCPDGAKLAATEFDIPLLERKLRGAIYLREQEPGHPYRIWIVADDLGLHVKLPGELELDKATGQIHSLVVGTQQTEGIPQAPLREIKLLFKSGFRAPLVTPSECGVYETHYEFTPWSGGPVAEGNAPMEITEGCEPRTFAPKLSAGSTESQGGAFSPFSVIITREDLDEDLAGLKLVLPRGLAASFAGIPQCVGLAAETGACPSESRIGKVVAAVGVGPAPLWVPQVGKRPTAVYLGGPYKGAPTSIVSVVPKQAGPFDFGDEIVRSAVYVDPATAQATAQADPLPQFVEGTPLHYRTINVQLDKPNFALNPTSCAQKQTIATLTSTTGKEASPTSSYAATGCSRLGFGPKVSLRLSGPTHRGAFPSLRAVIRPGGGAGQSNIGAFSLALPRSEFIENNHFIDVCTRVKFAANECPAGSIYGHVVALSPLFDFPLEGNIYLRTNPDRELPDMVAVLKGPDSMPLEVDSVGNIDSVNHGIRSTFTTVPDAPVTEIVATFPGGKKSLIVNSANLCEKTRRATAKFTAQNGLATTLHPVVKASCGSKKARRSRH